MTPNTSSCSRNILHIDALSLLMHSVKFLSDNFSCKSFMKLDSYQSVSLLMPLIKAPCLAPVSIKMHHFESRILTLVVLITDLLFVRMLALVGFRVIKHLLSNTTLRAQESPLFRIHLLPERPQGLLGKGLLSDH